MNKEQQHSIWDRFEQLTNQQSKMGVKMKHIHKWIKQLAMVTVVGLATSLPIARADFEEPAPTIVETVHVAPQPGGVGENTNSGAFPTFYFSGPGTAVVAGTGYADEDIMKYTSGANSWVKVFDGSNNGLPEAADIDALTLIVSSGYISFLMSFDTPITMPGLGAVDDSDVVRFDTWNGAWSLYLDGSAVGLTTDGEDIDGLTFSPGPSLVVSTRGNYSVKNFTGGTFSGTNKDLILLVEPAAGTWTKWLQGSQVGLNSTNNLNAVAFVRYNEAVIKDARYIVGTKAWTLPNGVAVGANDVSEQLWYQNGFTDYFKRLDNTTIGFPKIDAIEVVK